jgi:hypothetical protein
MEQMPVINREEIINKAKQESELSDLKKHADGMLRGFENFNDFSSNRAIWELVQNACDLTNECKIIIDYSKPGLSFTHNGKPFTTNTLLSLVKQVSAKYGESEDLPEVGKYGTGFITTHTFGRKFSIDSVLEANGVFFEVTKFLIDRSPKEWRELSSNIKIQKDNVYNLIQKAKVLESTTYQTKFTYIPETDQECTYTAESARDLEHYFPIVLSINNRLKQVQIIDKTGPVITFERKDKKNVQNEQGINLYKTEISKNGIEKVIYSIIDTEDEIEIILPINENLEVFEFSERVARLFLYYPLIGSEDFGLNFIINCNKFLPTEPRNGIHLKSNKDQVKDQEAENRRIVQKASLLIFDFLKSNVLKVNNPLLYARVDFKRYSDNSLLNAYFEELQTLWTEEFKKLPLVETANDFKPANEVVFFNQELLDSEEAFEEIYQLASLFYNNLPVKDKVVLWSKFVSKWTTKDIKFISHEDLVVAISKEHLSKFEQPNLLNYYKTLIAKDKKQLFTKHAILPNLDGKLSLLSSLLAPKNLTPTLIEIGKVLIPQSMERLIHHDFRFDFHFENFTRKDFSNNVKTKLDEVQASNGICLTQPFNQEFYIQTNTNHRKTLDYTFFTTLVRYCKLNNNVNSQSRPSYLTKIISKYYGLEDSLIYLPTLEELEENLDIRSSRKILVKAFFNLLEYHNDEWVKKNISLLLDIASCYEDSIKEAYADAKIYPNQINQLKAINELKRDINITEEVKDLYNKVTRDEIRSHLIYKQFNEFVAEDRFITNKYLSIQVEDIFFGTDIHNINEHPFKDDILKIISKLRDKYYAELFPRLDDKKANLMLEIVTNERTKDDIFSIVTLKEDQLKKLGRLVQTEGFEAILEKATNVLQQEIEKRSDFRHKYVIGTNIEKLIREKLSVELRERITFINPERLEASDVQGGQDIIVLLDKVPLYFIEVKSRWISESSVSMSKLQLERAVKENERYALCSVDISRYTGTGDRYDLSIDEVMPLTKFIEDIGVTIKPLIEENLNAEKHQNESIYLIDYRGIIPQELIQKGDDFDKFVNSLADKINKISTKSYAPNAGQSVS